MHHHSSRHPWKPLLAAAGCAALVAACSSSGSDATPPSTAGLSRTQAEALAKQAYTAQAALPSTPFPVDQRIGLGDWQLTVHPPTTTGGATVIVADLLNGGTKAATLDPAAHFVLRDGLAGTGLAPATVTPLGTVRSGATVSTTLTFRPTAPLAHPVLSFTGRSIGLTDVNVQLDLTPEAAVAAGEG